jgi:hypothetical protein
MKSLWLFLAVALLAGCAGTHRKGIAHYDDYDSVKIEQMVGNNVSQTVFAKTIVCLNARRETRHVTALTNVVITAVTNQTITPITNLTISTSSNFVYTLMTNLEPAQPSPVPIQPVGDAAAGTAGAGGAGAGGAAPGAGAAGAEPNVAATPTNAPPSITTNTTVSLANNATTTVAPNQRTANNQLLRTLNNQLNTRSNNLTISALTNLVTSAETNQVVSYVTNTAVISVTNFIVTPINGVAYEYFLYTELIPPPDFILAPGESLILLVDGVRHGFSPSQSGTALAGRRGYNSNLYRVPPEVFVAIANAKVVKVRFKGVNSVVEREMSSASRQHFREFLAKYFAPASPPAAPAKMAAAD